LSEFEGHDNLEIVSKSNNFNKWMYEEIFPGLKGDILEVGSGQGLFSKWIIRDFPKSKITLSEISPSYLKKLKSEFDLNNVSICKLDLNKKKDFEEIGYEKFDSIFALNVLEHIENDEFAFKQLFKMLKPNGNLIILVPCHKFLYNVIDKSIGHWRRYTKNELKVKLDNASFKTEKIFGFNALGIIGWYLNGNIGKNPNLNPKATKLFDKMVPILKYLEYGLGKKIGLSVISFSKK
jgi:SAM-dependent methyltransferase